MSNHKINCNNTLCKYCTKSPDKDNGYCTCKSITIDNNFKCSSFEPSLHYYYNEVWHALDNSNMIPFYRITEDLRIGLYYVMKTYNVYLTKCKHGEWEWLNVFANEDEEGNTPLKYENIITRPINEENLLKIVEDFNNGIIPQVKVLETTEFKTLSNKCEYGWLSPSGEFTPCEFAEHSNEAFKIIKANNWMEEHKVIRDYTDFLIEEKGYIIIHNPYDISKEEKPMVNYPISKNITKAQREFLFDYFNNLGYPKTALYYFNLEA